MSSPIPTPELARSLPRLNELAPPIAANSTHGPLSLEQFKGKWVVLFSHPADFTPVCTTEFVEFAKRHDEFAKRNVQLIGAQHRQRLLAHRVGAQHRAELRREDRLPGDRRPRHEGRAPLRHDPPGR